MAWRLLSFLRPTLIVIALFIIVLALLNAFYLRTSAGDPSASASALLAAELGRYDLERIELPRPEHSPSDVVRIQLSGLQDAGAGSLGILQCYVFASPGNRQATGPLENFGRMVRTPPYASLGRAKAVLIGRPQFEREVARILVTVVDDAAEVRAFAFVLARQKAAPLAGCWMTDAVLMATPWLGEDQPADSVEAEGTI